MSKQKTTDTAITLDNPIKRGEQVIDSVSLRKPNAGELRGLNLTDLLQLDVTALQTVIPRISNPALTTADVAGMDPADLVKIGTEVAGFLLPKSAKTDNFQDS